VDGAAEFRKVVAERNDGRLWKHLAHDRELSPVNFWLNQKSILLPLLDIKRNKNKKMVKIKDQNDINFSS
jgi:hypothetical protein